MKRFLLFTAVFIVLQAQFGWGQVPRTMSYQGVLKDAGGNPVDGLKAITFRLYDAVDAATGSAIWSEQPTVQIDDGVFSVILGETNLLPDPFPAPAWLGIDVGATGEELSPRTQLTASPYSFKALRADTAQYALSAPTGGGEAWSLTGNSGITAGTHFLGTTDGVALDFRVNNTRALRLEPNATSPNIIGGYWGNSVTGGVFGATIGGGGANLNTNRVTDEYSTIGGGYNNQAGNNAGTTNDMPYATVGGGDSNTASSAYSTVGGGQINTASGILSFAAGRRAKANHTATFVWADYSVEADFTSTADNQFLIRAAGGVGIGTESPTQSLDVNGNARIRSIGSSTYSAPVNQTSDGTLTTAISDMRLKKNIATIENALDKVLKLRGVTFNWKDDKKNPRRMTGMIAQEVKEVMPELIFQNPADGYYGINYGESSGLLVEAIKELKAENDVQKELIKELQEQVTLITEKVDAMQERFSLAQDESFVR